MLYFDKKLGDRLKYASKVSKFAAIVGEDEIKTGKILVKNLETGEQVPLA